VGYELSADLPTAGLSDPEAVVEIGNRRVADRLARHVEFVAERTRTKGPLKHANAPYGFPVMTKQETALKLFRLDAIRPVGDQEWQAEHAFMPLPEEISRSEASVAPADALPLEPAAPAEPPSPSPKGRRGRKPAAPRMEKTQRDLWE
jgi:hypothetical protein